MLEYWYLQGTQKLSLPESSFQVFLILLIFRACYIVSALFSIILYVWMLRLTYFCLQLTRLVVLGLGTRTRVALESRFSGLGLGSEVEDSD